MSHIEPSVLMKNRTLRTQRKQRGWSQARLAQALGVTTRTVIRWEQGLAVPQSDYREKLGILLGMTTQEVDLLWDIDENNVDENNVVDALQQDPLFSIAQLARPDISAKESLLIDPTIPQTLNPTSRLLGRIGLFKQVKQRLIEANRLTFTLLGGLPGVGKSSLAEALANDGEVRAHFGDGILWAGLGPQPHVLGHLIRWGRLLGVSTNDVDNPKSQESWGEALRSAIGTRQMLLVIDDAWRTEDALALQIGGTQCACLLTTRQPGIAFTFAKQEVILVPQLEETDGLALLVRFAPQLVQRDPEGALFLVRAVESLPLALILMSKALASPTFSRYPWPLRAALARLRDIEQRLHLSMLAASWDSLPSLAATVPLCLYAAIAIGDQQLSPQAQAALRALAIFPPKPGSFSEQAALEMSRQPRETLEALCEAGLLQHCGPGRYTLHQAVADYARASSNFQRHNGDWLTL